MMKILSGLLIILCGLLISGCDKDKFKPSKNPKTQARNVIVAGVPVHERDFLLSPHQVTAFNEAAIDEDDSY